MPFTFAHPAIVLPLNYVSKRWLSITGLVIGSIVPDFEYFIRLKVISQVSHTWPGLFWFNLPLGALLYIAYQNLVKNSLIDHLPYWLNIRLSKLKNVTTNYSLVYLVVVMASILIGATSHLLWDGFTHPGGYFVKEVPSLSNTINLFNHRIYIYKILQHGSTLAGLATILLIIRQLPKSDSTTVKHPVKFWLLAIGVILLTVLFKYLCSYNGVAYGDLIVTGIAGGLLGLIISAILLTDK